MSRLAISLLSIAAAVDSLTACSKEARPVGPSLPLTAPTSAIDPRVDLYQKNALQISQGGRYYIWYGCAGCHTGVGAGRLDLGLGKWRHGDSFDAVYASIADGHPNGLGISGERIPVEQLWQITAYVRELPGMDPQKRRRQDLDAAAEPHERQGPAPLQ